MLTADDDRRVEDLAEAECRRLLGTTDLGRLGFSHGALPAILPVRFALEDGHVVIPARRSSAIVSAVRGAVVVFAVDSYDAGTRTGWGVTLVGPTRVVQHPEEIAALDVRLSSPHAADRCYIAVLLGLLRGWRVSESPPPASDTEPGTAARAPAW